MKNKKGIFIAFEGIDGSGKSTQARLLAERLTAEGHQVYLTFEPTNNPIGSIIRDIFKGNMLADPRTVAALFVADRLHHLLDENDGILKKINQEYIVISDRYCLSSYAYQGAFLGIDWVMNANAVCTDLLRPHLNIYINMNPEDSMARIRKGREAVELYETEEHLKKVHQCYHEAIQRVAGREPIFIIDGNRSLDIIAADVYEEVSKLLT